MVTDDERREVARRLRNMGYDDTKESLICAYLDALGIDGYTDWVGIAHRLADLIEPPYPDAMASYKGWRAEVYDPDGVLVSPSNLAADLVRAHADGKVPSEPKVRCVAEVKVDGERLEKLAHDAAVELTGIDRDALLALADRMEEMAGKGACLTPDGLEKAAEAIREALGGGVVSETYVTLSKTFLAHVTGLSLCEGDGEDVMALVECDGSSGSASWLAAPDEAPELETVSRVTVEALT